MKNKILGQSSWCSVSNKKIDEFSIFGNKGSIHFTMNIGEDKKIIIYKNKKKIVKKIKMKQPLHKEMFKHFIRKLSTNNTIKKYEIRQDGLVNSHLISSM